MKRTLYYIAIALLVVTGIALTLLTNSGFVSFRQPYILQKSAEVRPGNMPPDNMPIVFVNVNVVPMDSERILANQTVLVRDGLIAEIGEQGAVNIPTAAQVIDGDGKYLMPGLADMHVHVKEENELLLFVAHGVTTVRDMWGTTGMQLALGFPDQLAMRTQTASGELMGPTIYTAGPLLEGDPPTSPLMTAYRTPEEAVAAVRRQKAQGYDFIKIYDHISSETFDAIIKTADEVGLRVAGHVPKQVGLDRALAAGLHTIEHLSGYIDSDAADFLIPEEQLAQYAIMTSEAGAWNCPTIGVYQMHAPADELPRLEQRPEMAYVSPRMKILWQYMFRPGAMQNISYAGHYPTRINELNMQMVRVLHEHDAKFILGTDTDNPYLVSGISLLDELDYLVAAGFTPYEAIAAGTRNAADALDRPDEFGTITVGKRADLLLLAANPLDNVRNVRQQEGVMVRGQWFPQADLQRMLDELVQSYRGNWLERLWPIGLLAGALFMVRRPPRRKRGGEK